MCLIILIICFVEVHFLLALKEYTFNRGDKEVLEMIIIQERSNVATNICDRMTEREREKERKKERERERERSWENQELPLGKMAIVKVKTIRDKGNSVSEM